MPEPVTIASLGVAVLTGVLGSRADAALLTIGNVIRERFGHGGAELPPNHDVENACRISLQQAVTLLAQTMDLQVARPKNLKEAFTNRKDADGKWKLTNAEDRRTSTSRTMAPGANPLRPAPFAASIQRC